jgi:hypothetical protein
MNSFKGNQVTAKNVKAASRVKASKAMPAATAPATVNKSRHLQMTSEPGKTTDRLMTDIVSQGLATNATVTARFSCADFGELSLTDMVASLRECGDAANRGDLTSAERMLHSQAVALNAIFGELARRAALNMGEYLPATETYLRLALKAQGQSRATLETLAAIKNPTVVFARQANINNGGQQQVNNGAAPENAAVRAGAHGHTANSAIQPNEQSGGTDELLTDARASQTTSRAHPGLEPVEEVNRAANR